MNYFVSYRLLFPTVKTFRFVLCLAVFISCAALVRAQDEGTDTVAAPAIVDSPPVEFNDENGVKIGSSTEQQAPEFRQVPDSTIHDLQKRKEFAYANDPAFWKKEPPPPARNENKKGFWYYFNRLFSEDTVKKITYGIIIAFFVFVIYRLIVVNKLFIFHTFRKTKLTPESEGELEIAITNLDERIRQTTESKQHRLAVRYMYLKALQLLNEKQWIRYHADGTNYEYVNQMSGRKLASEFGFLTRVYDYVWYGEFVITAEQFDLVHKNFTHFYNAVHS